MITITYVCALFYGCLVLYTTNYSGPTVCVSIGKDDKITKYISWFNLVVHSVFPFISILILNVMIIRSILKSRDPRVGLHKSAGSAKYDTEAQVQSVTTVSCTNLDENSQVEETGFSRNRTNRTKTGNEGSSQLIIMLLTVSFAFIILTSPISIRNVVYALGFFSTESNRQHAQAALVIAITSRLMLVNAAINFWLYSITGHRFRQDVKNILFKCF